MTINSEHSINSVQSWRDNVAAVEAMIPLIGELRRNCNVSCFLFGHLLVGKTVIEIMQCHRQAQSVAKNNISEQNSLEILSVVINLKLNNLHIDIGKLFAKYSAEYQDSRAIKSFVEKELDPLCQTECELPEAKDIVIYGFGRIGRTLARVLIQKAFCNSALHLRAIVLRECKDPVSDITKRANLLRNDSVHGAFKGAIEIDTLQKQLICNGQIIQFIYSNSTADIDYQQYGIFNSVVIDSTGIWRDEKGLTQHLQCKGVLKVLLTAPGKGRIKNIVAGVNDNDIKDDTIVSCASCTTNAIVPALKLLNDKYGIHNVHIETVHSYTNDQNLIDNFHNSTRRGRAAPLNLVITETNAANAVIKALPELVNKISANAIRVPTPNVSLAILKLHLQQSTTKEQINQFIKNIQTGSHYYKQLEYCEDEDAVSTDFIGRKATAIYDSKATIVCGRYATLYLWYDNEYGYCRQVYRVLEKMVGHSIISYPQNL